MTITRSNGQRLTKRGPQEESGYINPWFTLRNGEVGTKHVYAGTTRVVSKLVKQDKPNSKEMSHRFHLLMEYPDDKNIVLTPPVKNSMSLVIMTANSLCDFRALIPH